MADKKNAQFSVRVPDWVHDDLKELAENDRRPLASYVALVLEEHVKESFEGVTKTPVRKRKSSKK